MSLVSGDEGRHEDEEIRLYAERVWRHRRRARVCGLAMVLAFIPIAFYRPTGWLWLAVLGFVWWFTLVGVTIGSSVMALVNVLKCQRAESHPRKLQA